MQITIQPPQLQNKPHPAELHQFQRIIEAFATRLLKDGNCRRGPYTNIGRIAVFLNRSDFIFQPKIVCFIFDFVGVLGEGFFSFCYQRISRILWYDWCSRSLTY